MVNRQVNPDRSTCNVSTERARGASSQDTAEVQAGHNVPAAYGRGSDRFRMARRAGPVTGQEAAHAYQPAADSVYPHLVWPRCSCGWQRAGYVRDWLALHYHELHRAETGQP